MSFYDLFKAVAFKVDAEQIHHASMKTLSVAPQLAKLFPTVSDNKYRLTSNNLSWSFPVGLAAGFDKNAQCINFFDNLGFGAIEVGTVTKLEQAGNPRPRIFRYPESESLRNAMGFPNQGADKILKQIKKIKTKQISLGVNLGKNKLTTQEDTPAEYAELYRKFSPFCDYLVINISSPNTQGLRSFQKKEQLAPLLAAIKFEHKICQKPLFLKISPDLNFEDITLICELVKEYDLDGVIATNTSADHNLGAGGLSGKDIKIRSRSVRQKICECLAEDKSKTIIGVGGIDCFEDILDFWKMGGDFTQIYTSFIYQGPQILNDIKLGIDHELKKHGLSNLEELLESINRLES